MRTLHEIKNMKDLELTLEQLSSEVARMRVSGQSSFQDVQLAANTLTRAQLVLNELERVELRIHGVSSEMAERFVALETSIRTIRDGLYRELKCRKPSPSMRSDDADHPAD